MRIDLERALHDVASSVHDDATADRMAGQVRHMVTRVRRRRAARHTANGLVGVGAAAAIAVTTTQILRYDGAGDRVAPAGETSPTAAPADGFGTCGGRLTAPEGQDLALQLDVHETVGGAPEVTVRAGTRLDTADDPVLVLARDGVVVSPVARSHTVLQPDPAVHVVEPALVSCQDGEPLPAGEYEVWARQEVTREDGTRVAVVGGPQTLTVPDAPADAAEAVQARIAEIVAARELADHFPFCGAVLPTPIEDPLLVATPVLPADGATAAPGEALLVSVELRSGGGRHVLATAAQTGTVVLLVDGVVVGYQDVETDVGLVDLGPDDAVTLPARGAARLCGTDGPDVDGLALPPGQYQAVVVLDVALKEVVEAGGDVRSTSEPYPVVTEPFTVTVR